MAYLANKTKVSVDELTTKLEVSAGTMRRDLRKLLREGQIRREYGFVALSESYLFEPFLSDPGFSRQVHHMAEEKNRIGRAAGDLIQDGETIGIAAGTTTAQVVRRLGAKRGLTIVTNAVNVAMELSHRKDITIHLTGGYLSGDWFAMVGPRALDFINTMFLDKFFFGANGVHLEHGVTDRHTEEAAVNQALAERAKERILLVDHTKIGSIAKCLVCPIREVNVIITDHEDSQPFEALGIRVLHV